MRILQVTDAFHPAVGGIERYVEALGRELGVQGHQVAVATSALSGPAALAHPAVDQVAGIEVFRLSSLTGALQKSQDGTVSYLPTFADPVFAARLSRLIGQWRPDVVHAHGWSVHSTLGPARRHHVPLVVGLHEYGLICPKKTFTRPGGQTCTVGMSAAGCTRCGAEQYGSLARSAAVSVPLVLSRPQRWPVARFVANSAYVADTVARFSQVERARIDVVAPSTLSVSTLSASTLSTSTVSVEDHPDQAIAEVVPPGIPDGPFIMYAGAMSRHKGLEVLLQAHATMRSPLPLVVVGATRKEDLPLPPGSGAASVVVLTDVPHALVMQLWRRASIGVVPSLWPEPFGQVAVECLAAGTALVVTAVGGLADLVEHERTGLTVPPDDTPALATALDRLSQDDALRERLAAAGRASCVELTIEATTAQVSRIYDDVLAQAKTLANTPATAHA